MSISRIKMPLTVLLSGLGVGFAADLMLYDNPLGISVPIIMILIVGVLMWLVYMEEQDIVKQNLWLLIPLFFFAMMSAIRAEPTLRILNILTALTLTLLFGGVLLAKPFANLNLIQYIETLTEGGVLTFFIPLNLIEGSTKKMREGGKDTKSTLSRVGIGILLALPFLCIFTLLFSSADLVFNRFVENIIGEINLGNIIGHTMLTGFLGWLIMGGFAYALSRRPGLKSIFASTTAEDKEKQEKSDDEPQEEGAEEVEKKNELLKDWLGIIESSIVLYSVNALFLVFVIIQFAAMFGGERFLRNQGLTYSEYARKGFFELLAVSLITLALILALDWITRRDTGRAQAVFLAGNTMMVAMTVIILISAHLRLQLYEDAYGFTTLRLYSHVFMGWLAVLMVAVLGMIYTRKMRYFATAGLIAVICYIGTMNLINPDALIVRQNIARYEKGFELDTYYLGGLSADAVPQLVDFFEDADEDMRAEMAGRLKRQYNRLSSRQGGAGWASYHVSINRAYRLLDDIIDEIRKYDS